MLIQTQVDFIALLQNTGPVAKVVLAILLIFSVWSWGIILSKVLLLRKVDRESVTFWKIFRKGKTLSEVTGRRSALRKHIAALYHCIRKWAQAKRARSRRRKHRPR